MRCSRRDEEVGRNEEKEVVMREVGMQKVARKYIQNENEKEVRVRANENPGNVAVSVGSYQTCDFRLHSSWTHGRTEVDPANPGPGLRRGCCTL